MGGEETKPLSHKLNDDELLDSVDELGNFTGEVAEEYREENPVTVFLEEFLSSFVENVLQGLNLEDRGDFLSSCDSLAAKSSPSSVNENLSNKKYLMSTTNYLIVEIKY